MTPETVEAIRAEQEYRSVPCPNCGGYAQKHGLRAGEWFDCDRCAGAGRILERVGRKRWPLWAHFTFWIVFGIAVVVAVSLILGCAKPMTNEQIISEVKKCKDAGLDAELAQDDRGYVYAVICTVPKNTK